MTHSFRATGLGSGTASRPPASAGGPASPVTRGPGRHTPPPRGAPGLWGVHAVACSPCEMKSFSFQQAALEPENQTPKAKQSVQFSSVAQSCTTLCDPMNRSTPGLPVHHQLPEFTQTHVHRVGDAIQPSHPLSSRSSPAPNPSHHQGLFQ